MADDSLLAGQRVLDLADAQGAYCGRVLADLGADVLKVEPLGGSAYRRDGPFLDGAPHPERSLWAWAADAGKRSVTLDVETPTGLALLHRLIAEASYVIVSSGPDALEGLGLGDAARAQRYPKLIAVTVTAFGREGPYAGYAGLDLVAMAMGGFMYSSGDEDRPPLTFSVPQACLHAGAEAAAGALFANLYRQRTGRGQRVDVSAQEAVLWTLMNTNQFWEAMGLDVQRGGAVRRRPDGARLRVHWRCKDGYVTFVGRGDWKGLAAWMQAEGFSQDPVLDRDWSQVQPWSLTQDDLDKLEPLAEPFFAQRTVEELYQGAVQWRFILYPVYTVADLMGYSQLAERRFFVEVPHDDLGRAVTYPGAFARTSHGEPRIRSRAPHAGEHNREIYQGELGLSGREITGLRAGGVI